MSVIGSNILAGASGQSVGGYVIDRSVRLRSSASAYFNRTFASAGNRKTWTYSAWVKLGSLAAMPSLLTEYSDGSNQAQLAFRSSGAGDDFQIRFYDLVSGAFTSNIYWSPLYRDPSAWYHVVFVADTTQATSTNRLKLYVNGVQITATTSATYPSQNTDLLINLNAPHFINENGAGSAFGDNYLTEVNFIDGQALTPSSFGEYNADTGVWQPKKYAGTYGTNGFYLNFKDPASTTTIGYDYSGNGNNWTSNNISVTAGVTYDSMLDVPTQWADGGNGRGNYATLNPLWASDSAGNTYSSANLILDTNGSSSSGNARCTIALPSSGKFYCEMRPTNFVCSTSGTSTAYYGILATSSAKQIAIRTTSSASSSLTASAIYKDGVSQGAITTLSLNDILGFAIDCDASTVQIFVNNTSVYSGSYSVTSEPYFFGFSGDSGTADRNSTTEFNFGQRPFAYTPPSGFKALQTGNLPEPTIVDGGEYFNTVLYTGNGSTNNVTGVGFQPDFVWLKARSAGGFDHVLQDVIRGSTRQLYTNTTDAEVDDTDAVTSFNADGFTSGADVTTNNSGTTFVAWNWKANGAGVSNTDGSITSTVSAGVAQGFSVVTYTGTGSNATVGHGLGVAPAMVIVKDRTAARTTDQWPVYHKSLGATKQLYLHSTQAAGTASVVFNDTAPTSSVFSVGTWGGINYSGDAFVAYCFAEVPGFSKFGSYTGNGSADGPFVFTGFRPAFVMVKRTDSTSQWVMIDSSRNTYNPTNDWLFADSSEATYTFSAGDFLSNGIKLRNTGTGTNANGGTYIYMAFAENPFKNSLAR